MYENIKATNMKVIYIHVAVSVSMYIHIIIITLHTYIFIQFYQVNLLAELTV